MCEVNQWASVLLTSMMILVGGSLTEAATINIYEDGTGDYSTIQTAINNATTGDIIVVHDGTYIENINFNGKVITVKSMNGATSTTIDGSSPSNPTFGSVVIFNSGEGSDSVLDGFTVTGGTGTDDGSGYLNGGGIYCGASSFPSIANCIITDNSAKHGGGIALSSSLASIDNCTISNNTASGSGGGIRCFSSLPSINNCTINENIANNGGGGIYCHQSSPMIISCTISGNSSDGGNGGGIYSGGSSSPTITSCIITNNYLGTGGNGGGIYCAGLSPTITDCEIKNNSAMAGGGISSNESSPTITNCIISGNSAAGPNGANNGGGIHCSGSFSSPTVTNCIINNNSSELYGGGIFFHSDLAMKIINCTISGNSAAESGGGIYCSQIFPIVVNSIFWGNIAGGNSNEIYGAINITYSDIGMGNPNNPPYPGVGNINADPKLDATYHLTASSPCIGAGNPASAPPDFPADDIDGDARQLGVYDMGADEYPGGTWCTDTDNDTICDDQDNCPDDPNSDQADCNNNNIGDACDTNPCSTDLDNDGVNDGDDNCPAVANPTQTDSDNDGIGDACDNCIDTDGDGFCNPTTNDNCPDISNPDQTDTDNDGLGDVCDNCTDIDKDGYGTGNGCLGTDCNDNNIGVNPGGSEICDGIDNNCDGEVDEGCQQDDDHDEDYDDNGKGKKKGHDNDHDHDED